MLRFTTDWNTVRLGGLLTAFVYQTTPLPRVGEVVYCVDGAERVEARVISIKPANRTGGKIIEFKPDWNTQEDINGN